MLLFRQTSRCILQKVMKKDHISPVPKLQDLPFIFGRTIFATPYCSAEWVDPKAHEPGSSTGCSRKKDEEKREETTRRGIVLPRGFSLFSAGAAKKRAKIYGDEEQPFISTKNVVHCLPPEKPLSLEEWEALKGEYDGYIEFEEFMLRQMIDYNRHIDVAKSLLAAVAKRDGDIGYNTLMQYLQLCVSQKQTEEIYDICDIVRTRFKTLERTAATLLIRGLSHSPRWRDALTLLEQTKKQKIMTPTKKNYEDCIHGALMNQEINLAFKLFHELIAEGITPTLDTLKFLFVSGKGVQDDHLKNELLYILKYLRDNQIYPEESLMESIMQWFER